MLFDLLAHVFFDPRLALPQGVYIVACHGGVMHGSVCDAVALHMANSVVYIATLDTFAFFGL